MSWRAWYGIPDKRVQTCAVCGVEVKVGTWRCGHHRGDHARTAYHAAYYRANADKLRRVTTERMRKARERNRVKRDVIRALCEGIDEAQQELN